MVFAERYKWEQLFNDAMDAFSYGEVQLHRLYLPTPYIDLAFSHSPASPAARRFILNYAMALGHRHNSMSTYQEAILAHPEILSWMLARMDMRTLAGFAHDTPDGTPNAFTHQTDPAQDTYHVHNGTFVARCRCRGVGSLYPVVVTKVLPFPKAEL